MCEPTTIALAASAAISLGTAAYSADQQKKAGAANAEISENNARLAREDAAAAQAMGDRESQQQTWRTRAIMGQQRAAIAANGIDSQIGTPAEILGETAMFGEVDQQTIRLNTARSAWGFNSQATNYANQGALSKFSANAGANATILSGLSSAVNYGTQAYSSYKTYKAASAAKNSG